MSFRRICLPILICVVFFSLALAEEEKETSLQEKIGDTDSSVVDRTMLQSGVDKDHEVGNKLKLKHGLHLRDKKLKLDKKTFKEAKLKHHSHHKNAEKKSWFDGFVHSTLMIVSMEFMDKTFFISAIMAMSHNKWIILLGSLGALFLMNGISCLMGVVLPMFMSRRTTVVVASVLFLFFGGKMVYDGIRMDSNDTGELDEAQEEIRSSLKTESDHVNEELPLISPSTQQKICKPHDYIVVQIFLMIFFAEWGDRSQVSTILLAGTHPVLSVFLGGCVGYFITSFIAVLCGSVLQKWISPRLITIFGGLMFLFFSVQTLLGN